MNDLKNTLIRGFTIAGGIYFFVEYLLPESVLKAIGVTEHHEQISNGFVVIGLMAIGLGIFNLFNAHGQRIIFRRTGWVNSLALLLGLLAMCGVTIGTWTQSEDVNSKLQNLRMLAVFPNRIVEDVTTKMEGVPQPNVRVQALRIAVITEVQKVKQALGGDAGGTTPDDLRRKDVHAALDNLGTLIERLPPDSAVLDDSQKATLQAVGVAASAAGVAYGTFLTERNTDTAIQHLYSLLFDGLFIPLGSAMFALLGVYIASAAYRAFRVRSVESALMMVAAVLVMLGQISFGAALWPKLPEIRQWLLEVPNSAAFRAIRLGASIAGLMLAIRMWLSIESQSFGKRKQ